MKKLAILLMLMASSAAAKPGSFVEWLNTASKDVLDKAVLDLEGTTKLAAALGDTSGGQCYAEITKLIKAVRDIRYDEKDPLPQPHFFYTFESIRGLVLATQANNAVDTACAPLAQQVKSTTPNLVMGLVSGALNIGKLFGLP